MSVPDVFQNFTRQLEDAHKLANLHTYFSVDVAQHYKDTCAIRSQQLILKKFGIDLPQEQLMDESAAYGWYRPGKGTNLDDVGKVLALHGVSATQYTNASLHDIHDLLAHGKQCIVAVDATELWKPDSKWHYLKEKVLGIESANHALIVTDVIGDPNDPANTKVVVTDPGTGEVAKVYSGDQFMDAHRDSQFRVVATDDPTPDFVAQHGLNGVVSFGSNDTAEWWHDWSVEQGEVLDAPQGDPILAEPEELGSDGVDLPNGGDGGADDEEVGDENCLDELAVEPIADDLEPDGIADLLM